MARTRYIYEQPDWPAFRWDHSALEGVLASVHVRRAKLQMALASLGLEPRQSTLLDVLVEDVTRSSEIEGVNLDINQVRSSVARRLGLDTAGLPEPDRHVEGVVEMTLDATQRYERPLDEERLFAWHAALFPTGRNGLSRIRVGTWRSDELGPMQVVSGPIGRERVHFEAPAADVIPTEMRRFLEWLTGDAAGDPILRAATAHLWFVTVHPFEDGNGRIGRAIMDMGLARADQSAHRSYSMSAQILKHRQSYYDVLETTQKGDLDITHWLTWFLARLEEALDAAEGVVALVELKRQFWERHRETNLNDRQIKILNMLLDGFVGKLQTGRYAKITKCSPDTALRDLTELVELRILVREPSGGRSTSYALAD
ncbi:MAG: Fic family protein [Methanoregulaceae archaeon]|nr:Fic family protein [Methanoregulaceae archaeon]